MKRQRTFLWMALVAGLAAARTLYAGPSASTALPEEKQTIHWFAPAPTTGTANDLAPAAGLSRQAWTTIAGWHPGTSAFPDAETYNSRMCLFWMGHEPWQHVTHSVGEP